MSDMRIKDITNQKFGYLTAIKYVGLKNNHDAQWETKCECGTIKVVTAKNLKSGHIKSCGCKRALMMKKALGKGHEEISGQYWGRIKRRAKEIDVLFNLTLKFAWDKFISQNKRCALSGIELTFSNLGHGTDGTASLDRIDSTKGYVTGNVQWVHKTINRMKNDLPEEDFLKFIQEIYLFRFNLTSTDTSGIVQT